MYRYCRRAKPCGLDSHTFGSGGVKDEKLQRDVGLAHISL
jgi:hypothetical protein